MKHVAASVLCIVLTAAHPASAATYYVDPQTGSDTGDGSAARPWKTLAEIADSGKLTSLKGGDTVLLRTGYHGAVNFSGDNDKPITIAADTGHKPALSRLTIPSGSNWTLRSLIISPSFGGQPYDRNIVSFGDRAASSNITIEDCYIFTAEDASQWDAEQWINANSGIFMGRHGQHLTVRNNYIRNVRFGISLGAFDSLCEGNVIANFSADGIRTTRDGQTVQYNVIRNAYVSSGDGDSNHDDGIQCFLFNKGTGTVRNVKVIGNIIVSQDDPNHKLHAALQGVGFFDGPLVDFVVTDNVVLVDHWHGIALYDARNALVERNVVWTPVWTPGQARAWIMFGNKNKQAHDNTARNNYACTFKLNEPGSVSENNQHTTRAVFDEAFDRAHKTICEKFGRHHVAADRDRFTRDVAR